MDVNVRACGDDLWKFVTEHGVERADLESRLVKMLTQDFRAVLDRALAISHLERFGEFQTLDDRAVAEATILAVKALIDAGVTSTGHHRYPKTGYSHERHRLTKALADRLLRESIPDFPSPYGAQPDCA